MAEDRTTFAPLPGQGLPGSINLPLTDLIEFLAYPFAVAYPDGKLGLCNTAFERLTGYSRHELQSIDWLAALTPARWREPEQQMVAELNRTGRPVRFEKEYLRKDGSLVPIELCVHVVKDTDDNPLYYYSFITDISERRMAQLELGQTIEQRQLALDAAALGWWHFDPLTRQTTWDRRFTEIFGVCGNQSTIDALLSQAIHPEDLPELVRQVQAALDPADPQPVSLQCRIMRPRGEVRWIDARALASFEGEGRRKRPTSLVGTVAEVTERKKAQQAIANIARFPQENPNPVLRVSSEGTVLFANAASARLKGVLFSDVGSLVHDPWRGRLMTVLADGRRTELELPCADQLYALTIVPIPDAGYVNVYGQNITERKRAEKELLQSREDFARAQEVGAIGSWRLAVRENVLTWSDENHRIFGIPRGTPLSYETFLATVHPEDREYVDTRWKAGLAGEPYDIEHRIVADGKVKWVREKAYLEFGAEGALLGGFGITQDITERVQAEQALRESRDRFALLAYTANVLLQSAEPQTQVESLCSAIMQHLDCHVFFNFLVDPTVGRLQLNACAGIPAEEAAKIQWLDFGTAVCGCVAQQGCRIVAECIPETDDPRTELVKSYGIRAYACHPLLAEQGQVIGTLSFGTGSRDTFSEDDLSLMKAVTDQVAIAMKRMQRTRQLRESEERFRTMFEGHGAVMLLIEPESGVIIDANQSAVAFYGYSREQLTAMTIQQINQMPPEQVAAERRKALEQQRYNFEFPHRLADGRVRTVEVYSSPINIRNQPLLFSVIHDITERRRMEAELQRHADELAAANKELEAFSYSVAHDLRTPLIAIRGFADLVLDGCLPQLDAESRSHLGYIKKGADRMNAIIDEMLALSRISRQEMTIDEVDLSDMAVATIAELQAAQPERVVEVVVHQDLTARADAALMRCVLCNLLSNAWKYTGRTERPRIEFGALASSGPTTFFVKDNGAGFDMRCVEKLFRPFQRLHPDNLFPGIGVGLAIVERAISRHGGKVWAESAPQKGATFCFTLGGRMGRGLRGLSG